MDQDERPPRQYELWEELDYVRLAAGIAVGLVDDELAVSVGRTVGAVRSRAGFLLDHTNDIDPATEHLLPLERLRLFVLDGGDLLKLAGTAHRHAQQPLWAPRHDDALREAWNSRPVKPHLPVLADSLGVSEHNIVARLIRTGIADSTLDAVERLGTHPDSPIAARARIAADKQSMMLWVLTVTDREGCPVHVSLHPTEPAAQAERDTLIPNPADTLIDHRGRWSWTIAARIAGEGSTRQTTSGSFKPPKDDPATYRAQNPAT